MKQKLIFPLVALLLVLPLACKAPTNASELPAVQLVDLDGKNVELSQFQGKPLLINFWATWCGPCRFEIPMLNELHKKYASSDLVIVGISTDEAGAEVVKQFMKDVPIQYRSYLKGTDTEDKFGGIWGLPTNFFYDRSGKQVAKAFGLQSRDFFEEKIREIIR